MACKASAVCQHLKANQAQTNSHVPWLLGEFAQVRNESHQEIVQLQRQAYKVLKYCQILPAIL